MDKPKTRKQQSLPLVRNQEALESLVYLYLLSDGWLQDGAKASDLIAHHRRTVIEWAILSGVVEEDDVIPF